MKYFISLFSACVLAGSAFLSVSASQALVLPAPSVAHVASQSALSDSSSQENGTQPFMFLDVFEDESFLGLPAPSEEEEAQYVEALKAQVRSHDRRFFSDCESSASSSSNSSLASSPVESSPKLGNHGCDSMSHFKAEKVPAKELEKEQESCPICLCDLEDTEEITTLSCLHLFHAACIEQWAFRGIVRDPAERSAPRADGCPTCRKHIESLKGKCSLCLLPLSDSYDKRSFKCLHVSYYRVPVVGIATWRTVTGYEHQFCNGCLIKHLAHCLIERRKEGILAQCPCHPIAAAADGRISLAREGGYLIIPEGLVQIQGDTGHPRTSPRKEEIDPRTETERSIEINTLAFNAWSKWWWNN